MPYWPGRKPNVNDRFRTIDTSRVTTPASRLRREGEERRQETVAEDVNRELAELAQGDTDRQAVRYMRRLKHVAQLVNESGDKRRRPKGVTKREFKDVRALKLTQTAKIRKEKTPEA